MPHNPSKKCTKIHKFITRGSAIICFVKLPNMNFTEAFVRRIYTVHRIIQRLTFTESTGLSTVHSYRLLFIKFT